MTTKTSISIRPKPDPRHARLIWIDVSDRYQRRFGKPQDSIRPRCAGSRRLAQTTDPSTTFLSVMSLLELELGMVRIGRRDPVQGEKLRSWLDHVVRPGFAGRMLAMD